MYGEIIIFMKIRLTLVKFDDILLYQNTIQSFSPIIIKNA